LKSEGERERESTGCILSKNVSRVFKGDATAGVEEEEKVEDEI
jgi:hypothetical protein